MPERFGRIATWIVGISALGAIIPVGLALRERGSVPEEWLGQLSVFVLVASLPQFLVDGIAHIAEKVADDELDERTIKRGLKNLGAWVGVVERPLLLGALVGGFSAFLAGWYALKGIAGFRLGLDKKQLEERRAFQLFLLNNAVSFAGVALGWLLWRALRYPVL